MSARVWASRVKCDYPICGEEVATEPASNPSGRTLPADWLDLDTGMPMSIRDMYGAHLREFCPRHKDASLGELAASIAAMHSPALPEG